MLQNFPVPILQNDNKMCFLLLSVEIHLVMHILQDSNSSKQYITGFTQCCLFVCLPFCGSNDCDRRYEMLLKKFVQ